MKGKEKIEVYVLIQNGKTVCICNRSCKGCDRRCDKDVVYRDKFLGWEKTMKRNRYGK